MSLPLPARAATVTAAALIATVGFAGTAFASPDGGNGNDHAVTRVQRGHHNHHGHGHNHGGRGPQSGRPYASCTGDTVNASVELRGQVGSRVTAGLLAGRNRSHLAATGQQVTITLTAARASYNTSFDIAGRTDAMYAVAVTDAAGRRLGTSRPLAASSCAPGTEVPEAPAALLVPLSLLGTAGLVTARKRAVARV